MKSIVLIFNILLLIVIITCTALPQYDNVEAFPLINDDSNFENFPGPVDYNQRYSDNLETFPTAY